MRPALPVLLVLGLLLGLSCDDPAPTPLEPEFQVGALEGYVRAGGAPVDGEVRARLAGFSGSVVARTQIDSTGWYRLELPVDSYRIEVNSLNANFWMPDSTGLVHVEPRVQRYDLIYGQLTVRVATHSVPEALGFRCVLECVDSNCRLDAWDVVEDGQLEYVFPLVAPGDYRIGLQRSHRTSIWLPGASDEDSAEVVTIPAERPSVYEGALDQYASISGSVHGSWEGATFVRPVVTAFTLDSTEVARESVTPEGAFRLEVMIAQPVRLRVDILGVSQWVGGDTYQTATVFALQPGDAVEGVSVIESGIACELEFPGGEPVTRAGLVVRDEFLRTWAVNPSSGNPVYIHNLRPGRYFLYVYGACQFDAQTWATQWYEGADSWETATPIDVLPGQLVSISMSLVEGVSIEGAMTTADGRQRSGPISVVSPQGVFLCGRYSNPDGTFSFQGFGNGDYYLSTSFLGEEWWYPGTLRFELAEPIQIRNHTSVTDIEFRLPL